MNKIAFHVLLIINLLLFFSYTTHAQKWNLGAHIGVTASKMHWTDKYEGAKYFLAIPYPETQFRQSFSVGLSADYIYNEKVYSPFHFDIYNKRFSISTGGLVQAIDENGQLLYIQSDFLDYRFTQMALSGGIGYLFIPQLGIEIQPYFHVSLTELQIKVGEVIKWQKDDGFQQGYDFGISGYMRGNFSKFYLKAGYQYGIREIAEYSVVDAQGGSLGKFPIRNTMFLFLMGYKF
ncbi:MAG TPA: hypothetical protein PKD51_03880 [Saprospiraceae bacterium]|nr:hypothetical protein [Saprospiraceae bacterium]HMU02292.1 hypothetical protein [Saprospiraceae bacterium]